MSEENLKSRQEINALLKEEFKTLHERIKEEAKAHVGNVEVLSKLVNVQISLAAQIVREERALSGEGVYFPQYTPSK